MATVQVADERAFSFLGVNERQGKPRTEGITITCGHNGPRSALRTASYRQSGSRVSSQREELWGMDR